MDWANVGVNMASGRLEIDLLALRKNYHLIANRVAPAAAGAVVKADAYGLGADQIAPTLLEAGCRHFFVAHLAEALSLQRLLPQDVPLFILNGVSRDSVAVCAEAGLIPVLNCLEQAEHWVNAARLTGRYLPAALQVDSGMSRLGLHLDEAARLAEDPVFRAHVDLRLLMSHLACADTPLHDANEQQLALFEQAAARFPGIPRSLSNSGGAFLSERYHGELARAGIALYGGAPNDDAGHLISPVISLDARVIQVRSIPAGTGVGYGLSFNAGRDSRIATIGVGYADGLPRTLGNCGAAWFNGQRLPIAGRVSMDSITLDVTDLPEGQLQPGDWVELIGPHQSLDDLARDAGTISYEILTSLGRRYHRSYTASQPIRRTVSE